MNVSVITKKCAKLCLRLRFARVSSFSRYSFLVMNLNLNPEKSESEMMDSESTTAPEVPSVEMSTAPPSNEPIPPVTVPPVIVINCSNEEEQKEKKKEENEKMEETIDGKPTDSTNSDVVIDEKHVPELENVEKPPPSPVASEVNLEI